MANNSDYIPLSESEESRHSRWKCEITPVPLAKKKRDRRPAKKFTASYEISAKSQQK